LLGRLGVSYDETAKKRFITSEFNQKGASFRSPWSNSYIPASEDGVPPPRTATFELEEKANLLLAEYLKL